MTIELITGHAGSAHVSSADDGWLNVGTFGAGKYVLDTGSQLACTVQSANLVTIGVGDAVFEGRHVRVSVAENVSLDNGAQGMNRNDIVCIKYEYNSSTAVETASLAVIKGTASSSTPVDPTVPSGSVLDGATTAYMPLWRIPISGINVGTPEKLYGDVIVTLSGLLSKTWMVSQIPNLPAGKVTSGTFAVDRIPTLTADKIPSLDASKIGSGSLPVNRGGTGSATASGARSNLGLGTIAPGTALWNDLSYMDASQTANLSAPISSCMTGIVLHWEAYVNGALAGYDHVYQFIPKSHISTSAGQGVTCFLVGAGGDIIGRKYVYVSNTQLVGNANNVATDTVGGITFNCKHWVLSHVIAV